MATQFDTRSFGGRWLFAIVLVFGTYNPSGFSYIGWLFGTGTQFSPAIAVVGLAILIGWIIYLRATYMSMGWLGIALGAGLLACLVWLLVDIGLLSLKSVSAFSWVVLLLLSLILAVGMSWSHLRRRFSGQVDVDNLDDGRG